MSIWTALGLLAVVGLIWDIVRDLRRMRASDNPNKLAMNSWERIHGSWRG